MNFEIILVLAVLIAAVVLFVTEKLRVDLVALLVLLTLAISGVIEHEDAILGFSNHAVIAIASVLVLSGGLQRTGVADLVGRQVMRLAGTGERRLIAVMMTTTGLLSGIMNDIGVTALLLPVVLDIARRLRRPPSKLLMPLAFGSLLGGMTTLIGTSPNILIAGALEDHGLEPFSMFDFTPVGLCALAVGVVYMVLWGHRLLPERDPGRESADAAERDYESIYELRKVLFTLTLPPSSALAGHTLAESRLGVALGLNVLAILRDGQRILAPGPSTRLAGGDALMVEGDRKQLRALRGWQHLEVSESVRDDVVKMVDEAARVHFVLAEAELGENSELAGRTLRGLDFRGRFELCVLALQRAGELYFTGLVRKRLRAGDVLLVSGPRSGHDQLRDEAGLSSFRFLTGEDLEQDYHLERRLLRVTVPEASLLAGRMLAETRLGNAYGLTVVGILRAGEAVVLPAPGEALRAGDQLLIQGRREDLAILGALQDLEFDEQRHPDVDQLESDLVGFAEVVLSPRSTLAGRILRELQFRERYDLSVLAVWRRGRAHRSGLARMELRQGDAFLVFGDRGKLALLASDPDFVVVSGDTREPLKEHKAPVAALVMAGVLTSVASGFLPIYVAAPAGAALMVLSGCLSMEEAYRFIEWKALLLIAGMLSLGLAMQESGAAELIAQSVLGSAAEYGTTALIAGLFAITAISAQIMPTAAVAVLISPIALASAAELGLSPYSMLMVVAIASSCAFMSPVGHPVNLLVMGVGGYRFTDYTKVGLPLTFLVFLVVLLVLPLVWPL